jgi:hypothetical protein
LTLPVFKQLQRAISRGGIYDDVFELKTGKLADLSENAFEGGREETRSVEGRGDDGTKHGVGGVGEKAETLKLKS